MSDLPGAAGPDHAVAGSFETEICIVGAGPVGLTVARALGESGRRVIVLDRGPARAAQVRDGPQLIHDRRVYRGATLGRAFGAGGTSALWGGQLLPVRSIDLEARSAIGSPAWPLSYEQLEPHFETLQRWLGVAPGSFGPEFATSAGLAAASLEWQDWHPRYSKWIPFGRRNLHQAFGENFTALKSVQLMLDSRVQQWRVEKSGARCTAVGATAWPESGRPRLVRAETFVICAGALESARCVMELNDAAGGLGAGVNELTGRFLHDHLSVRIATVHLSDRAGFQRLFAPVFVGRTMRSLRMELDAGFRAGEGLPALYAHFIADAAPDSGFAHLRDALRGFQKARIGEALGHTLRIPLALPGVADLLFELLVRRRLAFPRSSSIYLHCDFEQAPVRENRVYLGDPNADGNRPLHVDWDVGDNVNGVIKAVQASIARFWAHNHLDRMARLEMSAPAGGGAVDQNNLYDIYHPAGTTRMSADSSSGVVDENLRVHGCSNVYVAGSAVFPSMGAANPTFTAMALGLRLAELIARRQPRD